MGGQNSKELRQTIKNKIDIELNQTATNINKIVNNSLSETITNITQTAYSEVKQSTIGANTFKGGDIIITGSRNKNNISQDTTVTSTNNALMQIIQDATAMQKMANDLAQQINSNVKQDTATENSLTTMAKLQEYSLKAGGPEGMLDSVVGLVQGVMNSLTGTKTSSTVDIDIENAVRQKLNVSTTNENNVSTSITTSVTNNINQNTFASCGLIAKSTSSIDQGNINIGGQFNENIQAQNINVNSVSTCINGVSLGTKIVNDLTSAIKTGATTDTAQTSLVKNEIKTEAATNTTAVQESSIMTAVGALINSLGGWLWIFIIGAAIIAGVVVLTMVTSSLSGGGGRGIDINHLLEQHGGDIDKKIYLIGAFIAFIILIAHKSIPLCGAILILFFVYFTNKSNSQLFLS